MAGRIVVGTSSWADPGFIEEIRGRAQELAEQAREVRLAFKNNRGSDAPVAAERMRELLSPAAAR